MAVAVSYDRRAILVTWDKGDYDGDVQLFFTNPGDLSDISNTDARANDGEGVATVPKNYVGQIKVEVKTLDGEVIDEGEIEV